MQEPTDDQLDGLFRKSGEEFDIPFDPAAWQDMKSRLDNHDRYSAWEHMLRWGLPVLLLLLLTAGSWNAYHKQVSAASLRKSPVTVVGNGSLPRSSEKTNTVSNQPTNLTNPKNFPANASQPSQEETSTPSVSAKPTDQVAPAQPDNRTSTITADNKPDPTDRAANPLVASRGNNATVNGNIDRRAGTSVDDPALTVGVGKPAPNPAGTARPEGSPVAVSSVFKRSDPSRSDTKRSRKRPVIRASGPNLASTQLSLPYPTKRYTTKAQRSFTVGQAASTAGSTRSADAPLTEIGSTPVLETEKPAVLLSFAELTSRPGQWPKPLPFKSRSVEAPAEQVIAKAEPEASAQPVASPKGLSVRFMASPDLSGIGLRDLQRPGTNVGLMVEYRLAPRWIIQAGALRSTKVYKAYPSDYEWPSNWTSPVRPLSVDGRCRMFDIPINLRYDLAVRQRSDGRLPDRWFVSGGATMYYMSREDYAYTYPAHTYNTPKPWQGSTGWNGFSHLNVSGGFERAFSRRLSWQVEPFLKVPLKGVGFFKIDLLSTGAFFSLRYKL